MTIVADMNEQRMKISLGGEEFEVTRKLVPISDLKLDPSNPRLGHMIRIQGKGHPRTEEQLEELLWDIDSVKALSQSIFQNGGLLEDPIVRSDMTVVEGNCRTVSLRHLIAANPEDPRFKQTHVRVLPEDVTDEQIMLLLGELHIAGKIEWRAFDQAEYVWKMHKHFGKTYDYLSTHLRWSRSKLAQKISAFEETDRYMKRTGDPQGISRFSHFEEFMKKPQLKKLHESDPNFIKEFGDWVFQGLFPDAKDVRHLAKILENKTALAVLKEGGVREAIKVLERDDPSLGSNLYASLDRAVAELGALPISEIDALAGDTGPRIEKLRAVANALRKIEQIAGVSIIGDDNV